VYGLIFLFRWMDHGDKAGAEEGSEDSAAKVWFSNQVWRHGIKVLPF
jgi:hypothetical protein